ncbi:MAG: hypothetical protein A4E69_00332 [Syntrophus sp. PtaB.Bin138]|nr:MAG: hypothetical protein A4E69_00332 [Syntrophus sp. PtaB.Bin138]
MKGNPDLLHPLGIEPLADAPVDLVDEPLDRVHVNGPHLREDDADGFAVVVPAPDVHLPQGCGKDGFHPVEDLPVVVQGHEAGDVEQQEEEGPFGPLRPLALHTKHVLEMGLAVEGVIFIGGFHSPCL